VNLRIFRLGIPYGSGLEDWPNVRLGMLIGRDQGLYDIKKSRKEFSIWIF
jgi:hypothetical protein